MTTKPDKSFTVLQETRYAGLKIKVRDGLTSAFAAGEALIEIRDNHYYLIDGHTSLKSFCAAEYDLAERQVYRLIDCARVRAALPESTVQLVSTESQARALKTVPASDRAAVVKAAAASSSGVTAKSVTAAAAKVVEAELVIKDRWGNPVPKDMHELWAKATEESARHVKALREVKNAVAAGIEAKQKELIYARFTNSDVTDFERVLYKMQNSVRPFAVCPTCQGLTRKQCRMCYRSGYVTKDQWSNGSIDPKLREMIEKKATKK